MNKQEKEVYQKTIEMYNGLCAICGNNQIQLHHIRYGGLYGGRKTYMRKCNSTMQISSWSSTYKQEEVHADVNWNDR